MGFARAVVCWAVAMAIGAVWASPAAAAVCGQAPAGGGEPAVGTLVLDTTTTQGNPLRFGSSTGTKGIHLV